MGIDIDPVGERLFLQSVAVSLSSAQLLHLNSAPVQLVAAPGAGKWINVVEVAYSFTFGTVGYDVAAQPVATFFAADTDFTSPQDDGAPITAEASQVINSPPSGSDTFTSLAANQALVFGTGTSNPTLGNGTLKIVVYYTVESV